jgi:hypothetical protein
VRLSRRVSWFLIGFGVWSWIIWPTFLKNIWRDDRSWSDGPTGFFLVHLALTVTSLVLGTIIGVLGVRGLRATRAAGRDTVPAKPSELAEPAKPSELAKPAEPSDTGHLVDADR